MFIKMYFDLKKNKNQFNYYWILPFLCVRFMCGGRWCGYSSPSHTIDFFILLTYLLAFCLNSLKIIYFYDYSLCAFVRVGLEFIGNIFLSKLIGGVIL